MARAHHCSNQLLERIVAADILACQDNPGTGL
jgi:hypothetical protein